MLVVPGEKGIEFLLHAAHRQPRQYESPPCTEGTKQSLHFTVQKGLTDLAANVTSTHALQGRAESLAELWAMVGNDEAWRAGLRGRPLQ